jgi:glycosyltransferase involved in cell wall biosynthesis
MLIAVMSVFEEEELLPRAIKSLQAGGVDRIEVFDGAWKNFGDGASQDRTLELAQELGCVVHEVTQPWESQEAKRTDMFHLCGAQYGDHVLVFDADEELEGVFPALEVGEHYNMMVKCVGPNDMPSVRGEWPNGDYYADYKPELRVFAYSKHLHCKWPGGYWDFFGRIEPYADYKGSPALPVVQGATFLHHGNDRSPERIEKKLEFYHREHPKRQARQKAEWKENPW